ncbi:MAG: DNA polymerase I [Lachnospiraceae bacterium]|nr:DNA polymerase I [Lachnospiraceae bacterium]
MDKILLIDGYSIINRAFYGLPMLTNAQGEPTNGVYGFLNILFKLLDEEHPTHLAVAFDVKAPTFRHEIYKEYKGTRKPMPQELLVQVPMLQDMLHAMGVPCVSKAGLEADDIIGTLSRRLTDGPDAMQVVIVSGDRDLLQLATDTILVRIPKTQKGKTEIFNYYAKDVFAEYGVTPTEFIDLKALQGDTSDNIPGLPGVGPKTATELIQKYHTVENAEAHIEEITKKSVRESFEQNRELAHLSKILATINVHAEFDFTPADAEIENLYTPEAYELVKRHNFKSLFSRFAEGSKASAAVASNSGTEKKEISYTFVSSIEEALRILDQAQKHSEVGMSFCVSSDASDRQWFGIGVAFENESYYLSAGDPFSVMQLYEPVRKVFEHTKVSVYDLKKTLHLLADTSQNDVEAFLEPLMMRSDDVSVMAYLLSPLSPPEDAFSCAASHLAETHTSPAEILGKSKVQDVYPVMEDKLGPVYAAEASLALRLGNYLKNLLKEQSMLKLYEEIELPLVYGLFRMERYGICVDATALREFSVVLGKRIHEVEETIISLGGEAARGVNLNSPKQLGEFLFETLKLPGGKKTKSGYSTAADVLDKLAPDYEIVQKILLYRQLTKLKSTYADALPGYVRADGRIHGTFNQTVTATGRISSADPNLQNIPVRNDQGKEIRKLFVPAPGYVFVDADYSQIELRILAHMSEDENLIAAYHQDKDIHAITAASVFHVPLSEVTPQMRRNAKAVNFGIVYGISAFGLSEDLSITRKEAEQYIERYFATYPKVKELLDRLVKDAETKGFSTTLLGRTRPIPELKASQYMVREFGKRVAMNAPIQGTAADIIKIAMNAVNAELVKRKLASRIVLQVHDELLIEAKKEEVEQVKELLVSCMKNAMKLSVDLEVSVATGENWNDAK